MHGSEPRCTYPCEKSGLEPPGQRSLWQLSALDASGNRKLDKQEPRERLYPAVVAIMAVGLDARTKPEDDTDRPFRS
jgi:hypothetical protein